MTKTTTTRVDLDGLGRDYLDALDDRREAAGRLHREESAGAEERYDEAEAAALAARSRLVEAMVDSGRMVVVVGRRTIALGADVLGPSYVPGDLALVVVETP